MNKAYRVTEKDCEEAWRIFADRDKYFSLSKEEEILVDAFIDAGQIKQETGEWPTLSQVEEKWLREKAERERKRLASWQPLYQFNERDLAEYEALLAREEFGPFADFVRVVVQMKKATGDFPTVQEVRAHCDANQKA